MGHQKIPVCSPMLGRWPGLCVAAGQPLRLSLRQLLFSVRFAEGSWPGVAFLYGRFCHLSILELSWFFLMSLSPPHWIIFARKFYSRGGVAVPPFSGANRQDGVKFVWNIWAPYASGAWPHSVAGGADACGSSNGHAASEASEPSDTVDTPRQEMSTTSTGTRTKRPRKSMVQVKLGRFPNLKISWEDYMMDFTDYMIFEYFGWCNTGIHILCLYIYIMDDGWWMIGFWLLIPHDCGHRWGWPSAKSQEMGICYLRMQRYVSIYVSLLH